MDSTDDVRDVKLYRASADLLPDILTSLARLLTEVSTSGEPQGSQLWISEPQVQKLIGLLEPFQEWPQLLDPVISKVVTSLVEAFTGDLLGGRHLIRSESSEPRPSLLLLPGAVCRILSVLCKIRGVKVITRFFSNEPRYLEPILTSLILNQSVMTWEERYIVLLWLSHTTLTPFDLRSLPFKQSLLPVAPRLPDALKHISLPDIAVVLLSSGLHNVGAAGKEREAASQLLVRLALRPDMQRRGLIEALISFINTRMRQSIDGTSISTYECLGFLSIIAGLVKSGSSNEIEPFLLDIVKFCFDSATTSGYKVINSFAPARKALVVILRASTVHALTPHPQGYRSTSIPEDARYEIVEDTVQFLLEALGDKDSPVRLAAAKALSVVCQKLDDDFKTEVVQAVLDTLEEDVLYVKAGSSDLVPSSQLKSREKQELSPNMTAVNPLKWQGLLLTLGHLLFRRTVPSTLLPPILKALFSALAFEHRSPSGSSVGGSVRDAACFGIWSLARKYVTSEMQSIEPGSLDPTVEPTQSAPETLSVLQLVANHLVVSSCLDPSGNIRRGSSAALQELIGRHPDTVMQGIALVQKVDYHAVARRSKAMQEVAYSASEQGFCYRQSLLEALLGWRGVRAVDEVSRRNAARAISDLVDLDQPKSFPTVFNTVLEQLGKVPQENSKGIAETRHGLLLTISALVDLSHSHSSKNNSATSAFLADRLPLLWDELRLDGFLLGNMKARFLSELILEAAASIMSSLARVSSRPLNPDHAAFQVLEVCLLRAQEPAPLALLGDSAFEMMLRLPVEQRFGLVASWLELQDKNRQTFASKGRIQALGKGYAALPEGNRNQPGAHEAGGRKAILQQLEDFVLGRWKIETQIEALTALRFVVPHLETDEGHKSLCAGLDNYTNDQRGDIGALARLEAIRAVEVLLARTAHSSGAPAEISHTNCIVQRLFRLAGEKLDKLRFEAWKCLENYFVAINIVSTSRVSHVVDVSTSRYFIALLQNLEVSWLRPPILQGIAHSIASGTDDLMRVSRNALIQQTAKGADLIRVLVRLLEDNLTDERQAAPLLEAIALLMEQMSKQDRMDIDQVSVQKMWIVVRRAHFKTANVRRIEAAIRIYGTLTDFPDIGYNVIGKLRGLLFHPYPTVRNAAADTYYGVSPDERLLIQDWSRNPKELRSFMAGIVNGS